MTSTFPPVGLLKASNKQQNSLDGKIPPELFSFPDIRIILLIRNLSGKHRFGCSRGIDLRFTNNPRNLTRLQTCRPQVQTAAPDRRKDKKTQTKLVKNSFNNLIE